MLRRFLRMLWGRRKPVAEPVVMEMTVQPLNLNPGDVVVVRTPSGLTCEQHKHLLATFGTLFPGHRIVTLDRGAELTTVRPTLAPSMN